MHNGWLPIAVFYKWLDMIMDFEQDGEICSIILLVAHASDDWRFQTQETCSCSAVQGIREQCDLQLAILRILTRALF